MNVTQHGKGRATRRQILRAGAGLAVGVSTTAAAGALSACTSSSGGNGTDAIRVIVPEGGLSRAFTVAARSFEEETGNTVEVTTYPYAEARQQQLLELASGTGGLDAILIDGEVWLAELHQYLEPVDDRISAPELDRFVSTMPPMFQQDGAAYALPFRVGGWVLIYRTDLFDAAGIDTPPETWDAFRDMAQTLTTGDTYGFVAPLAQTNFLVAQWIPFLWSFGGEILTPDRAGPAFNDEAGIAATEFLVGLYRDGLVPPGAIEADHDRVITAMQQGQAAMAITYSPYYLEMNDPAQSAHSGNFAVSGTLPYDRDAGLQAGRSMLAGWGVGIAQDSPNKDGAWALAEYLTRDDVQLDLAVAHGNSPTVTSVYEDPDYLEVYEGAGEVLEVLEAGATRPGVPEWTRIEESLALRLSEALIGDRTVAEALSAAEDDVAELLTG